MIQESSIGQKKFGHNVTITEGDSDQWEHTEFRRARAHTHAHTHSLSLSLSLSMN